MQSILKELKKQMNYNLPDKYEVGCIESFFPDELYSGNSIRIVVSVDEKTNEETLPFCSTDFLISFFPNKAIHIARITQEYPFEDTEDEIIIASLKLAVREFDDKLVAFFNPEQHKHKNDAEREA